jgi:hypothetical protein
MVVASLSCSRSTHGRLAFATWSTLIGSQGPPFSVRRDTPPARIRIAANRRLIWTMVTPAGSWSLR